MSKKWVTSDWHLGHTNIAGPKVSQWKTGYRNFDSTYDMNEAIISKINEQAAQDDIIYNIGDFCFGGHFKTPDFRRRIICQNIHIVRGNHDHHIHKYQDYFASINDILHIKHGKFDIIACHYAMRVWEGSHKGTLHAYGHSHGSIKPYGRSEDVGIDNIFKLFGEYRMLSLDEFVDIVIKRGIEFPDHHSLETNTR